MLEKIILIGAGGHCKSVMDSIRDKFEIACILDPSKIGEIIMGTMVVGSDNMLKELYYKGITNAFISIGSIGNTTTRRKIYKNLQLIGFKYPSIIDKSANVSIYSKLGEGIFIGKGAVVNAGAEIGDFSIINTKAIIEHDCNVGKFVHVATAAVVCGGVNIGDDSNIGTNATILQGINIGKNVMVGAGSVVLKNLTNSIRVAGNPAKEFKNE
ncbi:acetyltransferase [Clostridium gasigenes]|nr:acetyltransferase [Clostridium gasigenes]